jgi:methionyl aminopeptidase
MTSINLKTPKQIAIMKLAGQKLKKVRLALKDFSKPGVKLEAIENLAQDLIVKAGAQPSFSRVKGYHWATCINLNEGLVHGVPDNKIIKEGDLVSIDVGLYYQGFHSDSAVSFIAGKADNYPQKQKLLNAGQLALESSIKQAKPGNRIGHISRIMQKTIEAAGFNVARNLTGHGLGRNLHEAPSVPCFLSGPLGQTPLIEVGLTIAIETIYMAGNFDTLTDPHDNWTIITKDRKDSAMFEHSIAITKNGPVVLTG